MELLLKYEDVTYTMNKDYLDALKMITDEDKITKIAKQANNKRLRTEAINRINNQDILISIAVYDKNSEIRKKATQRVEDKELLSEKIKEKERMEEEQEKYYNLDLAKNNQYHRNRENAIKEINDEDLLEDIAFNSKYSDSRTEATRKITDEKILLKLAKESEDNFVRKTAIEKINDQKQLTELVQHEKDKDVRVELLKKISDQKGLEKIILDTYHELDDFSSRRDFVRIVNQEEILCAIAKEESDWAAAEHIASNINDEETLEYMALKPYSYGGTTYHQPNYVAITRIKNKDTLMRIYENTNDYENKITAGEKLKELGYLDDESLNEIKNYQKEKNIQDEIQQLRLDIAYADHNSSGDCIRLAKLYEETGNKADAKAYYERAIKEIDIIINSTQDSAYWIDKKKGIEEHLKTL